jgi:hypothetical protein
VRKEHDLLKLAYILVALGGLAWLIFKLGMGMVFYLVIGAWGTLEGKIENFLVLLLSLSGIAAMAVCVRAAVLFYKDRPWQRMDYVCMVWSVCGVAVYLTDVLWLSEQSRHTVNNILLITVVAVVLMILYLFRHKSHKQTPTLPTTDAS